MRLLTAIELALLVGAFGATSDTEAAPAVPAGTDSVACRRLSVPAGLEWVHDGFVNTSGRVVFGDVGTGKIWWRVGADWRSFENPGNGPTEFFKPILLGESRGETWLHAAEGSTVRLVVLDRDLVPVRGFDWTDAAAGEGFTFAGVFDLAVSADGTTVGGYFVFGRGEKPEYWGGLARVGATPPGSVERFAAIASGGPEQRFHVALNHLGTMLGTRLFWLRIATEPRLVELVPGHGEREIEVGVPWPNRLPDYPEVTLSNVTASDLLVRQMSFPHKLGALGDSLVLVWREALPQGRTRWQLLVIDPDGKRPARTYYLPTNAPWISFLPGQGATFGFLEQGPITGPMRQQTEALVLLPTAWLQAPRSPLSVVQPAAFCAEEKP